MIEVGTVDGAIRHIRICRPEKRNALGVEQYVQLATALDDAHDAAVVVLSSIGEVFCAGNDLAEFATEWPQPRNGPVVRFLTALSRVAAPVIAAVQGPAVGIGATMLLHCDMIVAAQRATLRYPFVTLGIAPEGASSHILPQRLGRQRAMDLLLSGRAVSADEALTLGLLTAVVGNDEVMAHTLALAEASARQPRDAVIATKALVTAAGREGLVDRFEAEIAAINALIEQGRTHA